MCEEDIIPLNLPLKRGEVKSSLFLKEGLREIVGGLKGDLLIPPNLPLRKGEKHLPSFVKRVHPEGFSLKGLREI